MTGSDVVEGATYEFNGYYQTRDNAPAKVTLEFRDGNGSVLASTTTGDQFAGSWTAFLTLSQAAPTGTQVIRVRLISDNPPNFPDAFFDNLSLTSANTAPSFTAGASASLTVDEDAAATSLSSQLEVNDPDGGQTLEWTVSAAPSNGSLAGFSTTESSGTGVQPSGVTYEPNTDYSGSDAFDIQVSDGNGGSATITVNVTVNNLAPVFNSSSSTSFAENGTGTVLDVNADNGGDGSNDFLVDYSITGGTDSGEFSIDASTGELTFTSAPDFENPTDSDGQNDYVIDVTANDGGSSNLDFSGSVSPGTNDNPVGIFEVTAGRSGASFDGVTVTNKDPGVSSISAARLYWSSDQTLEPGSDTQLDEVSTDASSAPSTIVFSGFGQSIPPSARYAILTIDVQAGATADVQFELAQDSDLQTPGGEIATVNGTSQSSFSALPLSNGRTALPVEMANVEAALTDGSSIQQGKRIGSEAAVRLSWTTASETNNAGFEVQRRVAGGSGAQTQATSSAAEWEKVGFVESKAQGGTSDEPTDYQFTDEVSFTADTLRYRLRQVDIAGGESFTESVVLERRAVRQMRLLGTYPNPARGQATVRFAVPEDVKAEAGTLQLYDVLGREVRRVRTTAEAGRHEQTLDTRGLTSGMYFLRLQMDGLARTQRMTVVR